MVWALVGLLFGFIIGVVVMRFQASAKDDATLRALMEAGANDKRELVQRLSAKENDLELGQQKIIELNRSLSTEQERSKGLAEKLDGQKAELEKLNDRMTSEFKLIASALLEQKGKQLSDQQEEKLKSLLDPFKERIKEFQEQVRTAYDKEGRERFSLKNQIDDLVKQNQKLSADADNLTKALKGDSKMQGDWGEMVLEHMLEGSGLVQGEEYSLQTSTTLDDGTRLRPDAVINLPGDKHIVIDAKVSLTHYERYASSTDEAERERMAKAHTDSVRAHIKSLSQKDYPKLYGISSPEFVLMFVPIESAFNLAQTTRREIVQEAIDQRVFIVTHSSLMASLRLFHTIWKNERIARNHLEIADRAGALYEKFVGFTEDMLKVGNQLKLAKSSYDEAMKKLSEGGGNLVRQSEMLKELGAKTNKAIDAKLLQRSLEEHSSENA